MRRKKLICKTKLRRKMIKIHPDEEGKEAADTNRTVEINQRLLRMCV